MSFEYNYGKTLQSVYTDSEFRVFNVENRNPIKDFNAFEAPVHLL